MISGKRPSIAGHRLLRAFLRKCGACGGGPPPRQPPWPGCGGGLVWLQVDWPACGGGLVWLQAPRPGCGGGRPALQAAWAGCAGGRPTHFQVLRAWTIRCSAYRARRRTAVARRRFADRRRPGGAGRGGRRGCGGLDRGSGPTTRAFVYRLRATARCWRRNLWQRFLVQGTSAKRGAQLYSRPRGGGSCVA
jgi:hypothetical protein